MKGFSSQLSYLFQDKELRRNLYALLRYLGLLIAVVILVTVGFQLLMWYVEGESHSWVSAFYWTIVTMTTLGYGDIVFQTDIGRAYSAMVLITGVVMLLVVLPFMFIRYFYAPWLEAQVQARAPRSLPEETRDHVIICNYNSVALDLIRRLKRNDIPYVLIEPDPTVAAERHADGLSVVTGEVDDTSTYKAIQAHQARLVLANQSDMVNANIALTLSEIAPEVPVAAIAEDEDSIDVLELSGADHVLPLKRWLGEQLANRVNARHAELHPIGEYKDLVLAELPVQNTPLAGTTIRETKLREHVGVSIIGVWERGKLTPARADTTLTAHSVPVVIGTKEQLEALNDLIAIYDFNSNPVLVVGGGNVGTAAIRALKEKDVPVHLIERDRDRCRELRRMCDKVFPGDASGYELLHRAGINEAPSVLLTTHDDATNIFLASYCRNLNPSMRIVSRITHERNMEAVHRAGADFVLSYAMLGVDAVVSVLEKKELTVIGEGFDLFTREVPPALHDKTLVESEIGARTGMNVVALIHNGDHETRLTPDTRLPPDGEILMVGTDEQCDQFVEVFEEGP